MPTAIRIENVSKLYRLGTVGTGTISHDLNRWWHTIRGKEDPYAKVGQVNDRAARPEKLDAREKQGLFSSLSPLATSVSDEVGPDYVWALKDINLEVVQGEILGIIGRNGAGKSTLLKLLSRVTAPTTGSIKTKGRIASLLEVGTGFHPELTGRENLFMNGAILGMKHREIKSKLDEIVEFSGCSRYLDTSVKRYSSGMTVRLGFAVAAHLNCEIMIVDEVLAVGDAEFQKKCIGKIHEVSNFCGKSVLFVSHNLESIRQLTKRVVWMEMGSIKKSGAPDETLAGYSAVTVDNSQIKIAPAPTKEIAVREVCAFQNDNPTSFFKYSKPIFVRVKYDVNQHISGAHIALEVRRGGLTLMTTGDADKNPERLAERVPGAYDYQVCIPEQLLGEGAYTITVTCGVPFIHAVDRHEDVIAFSVNDDNSPIRKFMHRPHPGLIHLNLDWTKRTT